LRYTSIAAIALLLSLPLAGQQPKKKKNNQGNPEGPVTLNAGPMTIAGEVAGDRVSNPDKQGDWPSIANTRDGSQWAIWIEWNDKEADRVLVAHRPRNGAWQSPIEIQDGNWDHYSPTIVPMPEGVMALWSGQSNGNFDLFCATLSNDGKLSKPERLTTAPFSDFNARAVSDGSGNVTVVWQSFRNLHSDIFARRYSRRWGPETKISASKSSHIDDWDPAIALDRNGTAWISWDGYETGIKRLARTIRAIHAKAYDLEPDETLSDGDLEREVEKLLGVSSQDRIRQTIEGIVEALDDAAE
jgi:hypothetical protein